MNDVFEKRLDMRDIYPIHGTLIRNNDDQPVDLGITYFQKKKLAAGCGL